MQARQRATAPADRRPHRLDDHRSPHRTPPFREQTGTSTRRSNIKGEISVQQGYEAGTPEVLVNTEIQAEAQLNQSRQLIEDTLKSMFADPRAASWT